MRAHAGLDAPSWSPEEDERLEREADAFEAASIRLATARDSGYGKRGGWLRKAKVLMDALIMQRYEEGRRLAMRYSPDLAFSC